MKRSRELLAATIGFGALYIVATAVLGTPPDGNDSGATVAKWFGDNASHVRLWLWLLTLAMPLFAMFVIHVRTQLPKPHADFFLFGAIAFAAETAVQGWIWAGLARHTSTLDPATARTLLDVASYWGPVLTSTTVLVLGPIALLGLQGRAGIPRWLGILSAVAFVEQVVETVTVVGTDGFLAAGGPMNTVLGAGLTAISWIALGIVCARTPLPEAQQAS